VVTSNGRIEHIREIVTLISSACWAEHVFGKFSSFKVDRFKRSNDTNNNKQRNNHTPTPQTTTTTTTQQQQIATENDEAHLMHRILVSDNSSEADSYYFEYLYANHLR